MTVNNTQYMSRDEFREGVFKRDSYKCIVCGQPAKDAHHLIERRLFGESQGYFIDNGVSLCETHHIEAEQTTLTCDFLREKANIKNIILPEHFETEYKYDKWGNVLLPNGNRLKGELFFDESVQKILNQGGVLNTFQKYIKYPRTYHVHWSNLSSDDKMLKDESNFIGKRVIVSLKMDGENTSVYNDYIHARSLDSNNHESRNWVKGMLSKVSYLLDDNMRICGENLYAVHTVRYNDLKSYFYMFSFWIDNMCLSWEETVQYATILGLETVPVIYDGIYDKEKIITAFEPYRLSNEGYVIRLSGEFSFFDFRKSVAKYVRPEFRNALNEKDEHWTTKKIEKNKLIE